MATYRKEWECCGSVTETDSFDPVHCPFCTDESGKLQWLGERLALAAQKAIDECCDLIETPAGNSLAEAMRSWRTAQKEVTSNVM